MNNFYKRIISDTFLNEIENESIKLDTKKLISSGYEKRIMLRLSQKEYANLIGVSEVTVKRIELGKCYNLKLISKYENFKINTQRN